MYKTIIEYAKINKNMKVKFNLVLKDDANKFNNRLLDKFNINGVDYLKINPHPYLTIDISSKMNRGESWSSNNSVTLNQYNIFSAKRCLRKALNNLKTEDLFVYMYDKLVLNRDVANTLDETKFISSNKHIMIVPSVVYDDEDTSIEYEGLLFMINSVDNYCALTIEESEYLYDILDKINLIELSLQVINSSMMLKNMSSKKLNLGRTITEEQDEEDVEINFNPHKEANTIPNI